MNKAEFLFVFIITVIVLVIWGASSYLHQQNASIPNPDAKQYLEPVDPNFDQGTLDKINTLSVATASSTLLPAPSISASPSATPKPTAKASASSTPSPKPSPSVSPTP